MMMRKESFLLPRFLKCAAIRTASFHNGVGVTREKGEKRHPSSTYRIFQVKKQTKVSDIFNDNW